MEDAEKHQSMVDDNCQESRSRKNAGSIPYDLLTLRYHDTDEGAALLGADAAARSRSKFRSNCMYDNANRSGFNPVTGDVNPLGMKGREPPPSQ